MEKTASPGTFRSGPGEAVLLMQKILFVYFRPFFFRRALKMIIQRKRSRPAAVIIRAACRPGS